MLHKLSFLLLLGAQLLIAVPEAHAQFFKKGKDKEKKQEAVLDYHNHFFEGVKARHLQEYDKALEQFQKCLEINEDDPALYYEFSQLYWATDNKLQAVENAKRSFELKPKSHDMLHFYVNLLLEVRDFTNAAAAVGTYRENSSNASEDIRLANWQIDIHKRNRAFKEAAAVNAYLLSEYGWQSKYIIQGIELAELQGKFDKALELARDATKKTGNSYRWKLEEAQLLSKINKYDESKALYESILEEDKSKQVHLELGLLLLQENDERATDLITQAFQSDRLELKNKWRAYDVIRNARDQLELKRELLSILAETEDREAGNQHRLGQAFYELHEYRKAIPFYEESYDNGKVSFAVRERLIELYWRVHEFGKMDSISYESMELYPSQPRLYLLNGLAKTELGDFSMAEVILENGKALVLSDKGLEVEFELALADVFHHKGNEEEADSRYEKLLKEFPDNTIILNAYAYALAQRNERIDEALKMSKQTIDLQPTTGSYLDTYGYLLFLKGDYENSIKYLQKAKDLIPYEAEVLEHLADAHLKVGNTVKAVSLWRDAFEITLEKELKKKIEKYEK